MWVRSEAAARWSWAWPRFALAAAAGWEIFVNHQTSNMAVFSWLIAFLSLPVTSSDPLLSFLIKLNFFLFLCLFQVITCFFSTFDYCFKTIVCIWFGQIVFGVSLNDKCVISCQLCFQIILRQYLGPVNVRSLFTNVDSLLASCKHKAELKTRLMGNYWKLD